MKNAMNNFKKYSLYLGILFMSLSLSSCSDDDDGVIDDVYTGTITAVDQTIADDVIIVENVDVDQDSWLVAVHAGEENTDNFIAGPVLVEEGESTDVILTLNADAELPGDPDGDEIVLKLYADDDDGVWDTDDEPITDTTGAVVMETITVMAEGTFSSFDQDNDGRLDENEVPNTYVNDFEAWDIDDSGSLSEEEFYNTNFYLADADDDDFINEDEWNTGYASMYRGYIDDDFATYDADDDDNIDVDEWNDAFANSVWFDTYDADADTFVTDVEWDTGLYSDWDLDDDGYITEDEYNTYSPYTLNW